MIQQGGAGDTGVVRRVEVTKSPEDKRQYRGLQLDNGIRALLVSDASTDKSAASAAVHVGSLKDPRQWQGLAHFCEHMLFLGTETHPEEDGYAKFISEHGGHNNAYTADDHTCYYFDVAPASLGEALHRFSRFFVCPLFTESATEREVNAVHSEHTKNIPQDTWRQQQLEHTLANKDHDYSKFFTGSLETLLPKPELAAELRNQLLQFHAENYSANRLSVVVLGRESLAELETMVVGAFGDVVNKDLAENRWSQHPYDSQQLGVKVLLEPNKDLRSLRLVFPMPDYQRLYRSSPDRYVSHLIGHEGPGSVLAYLQERGWSNSLSAGYSGGGPGFGFFRVVVDLTEEGLGCVDSVAAVLFQYVGLLRQQGPKQWIFEEERDLERMSFRFKDKETPSNFVVSTAPKLLYYELQDALTARIVLDNFLPDTVSEIIDRLRPDNCKIFVCAKSLAEQCDSVERYYGVRYRVQKLTEQQLKLLETHEESAKYLRLPEPNPFISTDFSLKDRRLLESCSDSEPTEQQQQQQQQQHPTVIIEENGCRLWFKQDDEYLLPKCCYTFQLMSPIANCEPLAAVSCRLYLSLIEDALSTLTYDAELAGLNYSLESSGQGVVLCFSGYNEKLPVLMRKVLERLRRPNIEPVRYRSIFDCYKRSLENFKLEQPYRHGLFNLSLICRDVVWTHAERLEALAEVSLDSVLQFGDRIRSRLHVESLIYGNSTAEEAEQLSRQLLQLMGCSGLRQSQMSRSRDALLPAGSCHTHRVSIPVHKSSACAVYYQLQACTELGQKLQQQVFVKLLVQVLQERFFDQLRTKEQLGYIVAAAEMPGVNTEGLVLIVQSERHPVYLEQRIDQFLSSAAPEMLSSMTEQQFADHVGALDNQITEKPKKLSARNRKYYSEISSSAHCFDRADRLSHILRNSVDRQQLMQFYQKWLDTSSPHCRRLALHVVSEESFGSVKPEDYAEYTTPIIEDVPQFKRQLPLGPLPPSAYLDRQQQQQHVDCAARL